MEQEHKAVIKSPAKENHVPSIDHYKDIVDWAHNQINYAHKEIDNVRKVYYWLGGCLTVLISVGMVIFTSIYYKNSNEMKEAMQKEVAYMKSQTTQEVASMKYNLQQTMVAEQEKIETRIDDQFKKENIEALVRNKAQERIDHVADPIIEEKINKKVRPVVENANNTLKKVDVEATKMQIKVSDIASDNEFNSIVIAAQNDDKGSFDRLQKIANDKSDSRSLKAKQFLAAMMDRDDNHYTYVIYSSPPVNWGNGLDPNKMSINDFEKRIKSEKSAETKTNILYYLVGRVDIPKKEKLDLLVRMLEHEQSTKVSQSLFFSIQELSGKEFKKFDTKSVITWWNNNKETSR